MKLCQQSALLADSNWFDLGRFRELVESYNFSHSAALIEMYLYCPIYIVLYKYGYKYKSDVMIDIYRT